MEKEIKVLKAKIEELSQENLALREINVAFQLENYKLKSKIKNLEDSPNKSCSNVAKAVELDEFLENDDDPLDTESESQSESSSSQFEDITEDSQFLHEVDIKEEPHFNEELDLTADCGAEDDEDIDQTARAFRTIRSMAAKQECLKRIDNISSGRKRDATFMNVALDIVFGRPLLAASSITGQYRATQTQEPRPPLDPKKLSLVKQAFAHRMKIEKVSDKEAEERLKTFSKHVSIKIQNMRKLEKRKKGISAKK